MVNFVQDKMHGDQVQENDACVEGVIAGIFKGK